MSCFGSLKKIEKRNKKFLIDCALIFYYTFEYFKTAENKKNAKLWLLVRDAFLRHRAKNLLQLRTYTKPRYVDLKGKLLKT